MTEFRTHREYRKTGWVDPEIMNRLKSDDDLATPVSEPPVGEVPNVYTSEMTRTLSDESFLDPELRYHMPVIDIDFDASLVPSSTPGHFHLYLNLPVEHEDYMSLLDAMHRCGIIGDGYHRFSKERGFTVVRMPHSKKTETDWNATHQDIMPMESGPPPRHLRSVPQWPDESDEDLTRF